MKSKLIVGFIIYLRFSLVIGSAGDRSPYYQKCLNTCTRYTCTQDDGFLPDSDFKQDTWSQLLLWGCDDECRYHCMWRTVKVFRDNGGNIPKFHGKWPFVKMMGVQEPASAFSSFLNLAANAYMYRKLCREFTVRGKPLVLFWHVFAIVCMNAWVWSIVFHTRDKPFTEFMDYACALSMVMALFVAGIVRVFHQQLKLVAAILMIPLLYFVIHVQYLYTGVIDYDYNMKVNVFFGVCGWSVWAWRARRRRARALRAFLCLSAAALALELLDFPPAARAWDAHALWHLATAPLPLLFYRFVLDDLRHIQSTQYEKLGPKRT